MAINDYNDPIVIKWETDEYGNKISILKTNEEHMIVKNKFTLKGIPDPFNKVQITGLTEIKLNQAITSNTQFKVDYTTGEITFHSDKEAETITVASYYSRGILYYPSSRIYTELDNTGNVKETLADIFDKSKVVYKTPVATYADIATTYPSPSIGEAVQVEDNGRFYRWDGSTWGYFQILHPTQLAQILTDMGDVAFLTTTDKSNLVNAINEHDNEIGVLTNLTTTEKSNLVGAVSEVQDELMTYQAEKANIKYFGAHSIDEPGFENFDSTTAIQAAIDSLPLNTADVGILSPKGFANGGEVVIPRGRYKITGTITLRRGVRIVGQSRESSQIVSFTPNSVFKYLDEGRYIQDEIVFENLSIWQDATVVATSGAGIEVFLGSATVQSVGIICRNVLIEGTHRGFLLGAGVWCSFDNCNATKCVSNGFELKFSDGVKSVSTTSTTFKNCYASICGKSGFYLERGGYNSMVGCASDSNVEYGYVMDSGLAHSILASGAEENGLGAVYLKDTEGIILGLDVVYTTSTGTRHGVVLSNAKQTTLLGGKMNSVSSTGYGIKVNVNGGNVVVIGTVFSGNFENNICDSVYKFLNLTDANGLVGSKNNWAIGVTQQPDPNTTFQVGGNADSETDSIVKVNGTFTGAGAIRNSAQFIQAVTANTVISYLLLIGTFIANAAKGAASTIARAAGLYVQEQTSGTTANANIMIDATAGTVPVGTWDIYSDSSRESLFKSGKFRFLSSTGPTLTFGAGTPEGVVNAPVGSLFCRTDGGASTTLYVKQSGTGNTGWVAK
jgi:hypothetical protein